MSTRTLAFHNVAYLYQALDLLEALDEQSYTETRPPYFSSGVGEHLRHIIEHYQCFLAGLPAGQIDYDGRTRDRRISSERNHAAAVIREVIAGLESVSASDDRVTVCLDGSDEARDADPWSTSTVRRELQYLQAHTVHHYALIAFILRLQGREPSAEFGVAPSTLRFRAQQAAGSED